MYSDSDLNDDHRFRALGPADSGCSFFFMLKAKQDRYIQHVNVPVLTCESAFRTLILCVEMNRSTSVRV